MEVTLQCERLVRSFGERTAVDGVTFEIRRGETYGLLGPNGAGKTTTISMVAGVLAPDAGAITVCGLPMTVHARDVKALIGLVPQEVALYGELSVEENLAFFGRLQGLSGARLNERIRRALDVVSLDGRAGDRTDELSGGMRRRANLAAGLLHEPPLLVLDEPTVGIDAQSRNQILETVARLAREGLSVLYTTHYMEEAERLCDRIAIMDAGRVVAEGTARDLVRNADEPETVSIAGSGALDQLAERAGTLPGVSRAVAADGRLEIACDDATALLALLVRSAADIGVTISALDVRQPDLESAFLALTGRALRDA